MLVPELGKEKILKLLQCSIPMAGYGHGLSLVSGRIDLDEMFELIVVDVI